MHKQYLRKYSKTSNPRLSIVSAEPEWHLIFGGYDYDTDSYVRSVELFNWQTGEQCDLPQPLPFGVSSPTAQLFEDAPVFCGGRLPENKNDNRCHRFNAGSWERVRAKFFLDEGLTLFLGGNNDP
jgi:hypothetical protein